jgi:hypothetical protein
LLIPKKKKEKEKKGTPPWNVNVGGHPMESASHGLRKERGWRIDGGKRVAGR